MPTNQYSPTSEQPYQPYVPPEATPAAPPTVAEQQPGYQFNGAPISKGGAVAGVLDNILRGYMRGKQEGEAQKVMKLKAKTDNLQASYNQDAKLLYDMAKSGVSQDSPEYKQAVSAVQGSWGALQEFIGSHINGDDSSKKKKSKSKTTPDAQANPLQDLQSPDPNVRAQALYKMSQKMGPPVLMQVSQFNTPQAKQQRQNETAAQGLQTGDIQHQQNVQQAQATIDDLNKTPRDKWTPAMQQQYEQAAQVVSPVEAEKPGQQAQLAVDALVRKKMENPDYQFTEGDRQIFRAAKIDIDPKQKIHVTSRGEIIAESDDGNYEVLRGPQKEYEPHGRAGGSPADKSYAKWDQYYKDHYPDMAQDERDALVRRKVEGANQQQSGAIAHDAISEPKQFDNDVLSAAVDNLRKLPQYAQMKTLDDALANIVGQGDNGYQYHGRADLGKPDKHGKYSGGVTEDQLKDLERDLQTQIRSVMSGSKETALSPQARRAAMSRMQPLFGPAASPGSGASPASPQAAAATTPAPNSSAAPGGKKESKGIVRKAAFLKENPEATEADWQAIKPQLQQQGYDTKDE